MSEINSVESYDSLVHYLENWMSFDDNDSYDFIGMVGLLKSCLKNMNKYGIEGDFEQLNDILDDESKVMLEKIVSYIQE